MLIPNNSQNKKSDLNFFHDFDFTDFWNNIEYSIERYTDEYPDKNTVSSIEKELGFKLPQSYIEFMRIQNGGMLRKNCFPVANMLLYGNCLEIDGILSIGRDKPNSICGELGNKLWLEEWGYPATGIYICDTPTGGHDMILLDYSKCGSEGEPEVVHIDQELGYKKTFLAKNFETFIKGLKHEDFFKKE